MGQFWRRLEINTPLRAETSSAEPRILIDSRQDSHITLVISINKSHSMADPFNDFQRLVDNGVTPDKAADLIFGNRNNQGMSVSMADPFNDFQRLVDNGVTPDKAADLIFGNRNNQGTSVAESNFLLLFLHFPNNNSSTFSFSIPIATSFSSSLLPPFEQHPPPHPPPQVCVGSRRTDLHSTLLLSLNISLYFFSLSYELHSFSHFLSWVIRAAAAGMCGIVTNLSSSYSPLTYISSLLLLRTTDIISYK
jgi:hypothetical protein